MDLNEVKVCLRALLSSSPVSCSLNSLLNDFRATTGGDLPLFGYKTPLDFLRSLDDTLKVVGDHYSPTVCLVESSKSSHITSLVARQRSHRPKRGAQQCRKNGMTQCSNTDRWNCSNEPPCTKMSPKKPNIFSVIPNSYSCNPSVRADKKPSQINLHSENPYQCENKNEKAIEKLERNYLKGVSDSETHSHSKDNLSHPVAASHVSVNDGIKNKLRILIKGHPNGLWCCELPDLFLQEFNSVLDYREYGYTSMIQMMSELPDVFRCVRPGKEDWILFDASAAPTAEEQKLMNLHLTGGITSEIKANLQKLLLNCWSGEMDLEALPDLYRVTFGSVLDFQSLGFHDLKSFLESLEGTQLTVLEIDKKWVIKPGGRDPQPPPRRKEAVPPITEENDIFAEIFPIDVVGPKETFAELDLRNHLAVGHRVEVCVAEVWSPRKFYVQLNKFKNRLHRFMDDLQKFYNVHLNKYKMPEVTIRPKQLCVGLYNADPEYPDEWHRGKIVKVINERTVLVNFVDYGTEARAFPAQLSGVAPLTEDEKWPVTVSRTFLEYLKVPYLEAEIVEMDHKKPSLSVILFDTRGKSVTNINKMLITEKLAKAKEINFDEPFPGVEDDARTLQGVSAAASSNSFSSNCSPFEITDEKTFSAKSEAKRGSPDAGDEKDGLQTFFWNFKKKIWDSQNLSETTKSSKNSCEGKVFEDFEDLEEIVAKSQKTAEAQVGHPGDPLAQKTGEDLFQIERRLEEISVSASTAPPPPVPETLPRLPPGLESVAPVTDVDQIKWLMTEKEAAKKRTNMLALELLVTNPNIKKVALSDPALALTIATEMAEAYVTSEITNKISMCYVNTFTPVLGTVTSQRGAEAVEASEKPPATVDSRTKAADVAAAESASDGCDFIQEKTINNKKIHFVKIEGKLYVCVEEIIHVFTLICSREVADRIFHIKKTTVDYLILDKNTNATVVKAIKRLNLPGVNKKKNKKTKLYLLAVEKVIPFLQTLGCMTDTYEKDFKVLKNTLEESPPKEKKPY